MTGESTGNDNRLRSILDIAEAGVDELDLDREVGSRAESLLRDCSTIEGSRAEDASIAAGAVYAACLLTNNKLTQPTVGEAFGVTPTTIRKHYLRVLKDSSDMVLT